MISISNQARIFIYGDPINMLKSFEGLSKLVKSAFPGEIFKGYFVFLNKLRDRIKVLYWDGDGFVIWYKLLEKGSFLRQKDGSVSIERREFFMLLEGVISKKFQTRFCLK